MKALVRISGLVLLAVVVSLGVISLAPTGSASAPAAPAAASSCATQYGATGGDSWAGTELLQRTFYDASGPTSTSNCFHLTVNKHTDLQDHERITVTWSGAHPTTNRAVNPYGENGLTQGYPVVMMECRGSDPKDGSVTGEQVSPDTCWTNTTFQRSASANPGQGIWEQDASSTPPDNTAHLQWFGTAPSKIPASCNINSGSDYAITPYKAADGTIYPGCDADSMPPEATVSSVEIPNEVYAYTSPDGSGTFPFEVRTSIENRSLGCTNTVPCTLEVIPIDGINCDNSDPTAACNQVGADGGAPPDAVSPSFWFSASNWNRRIAVPLTFTPPPSACSIAKAGKPVPFYGSELLGQAALQWTPAYCLNKSRFNWQDYALSDDAAFSLMQGGGAAAAEVSDRGTNDTGIGYAPTAATGWAIAFDIDKPNNGGQQMTIKLNALLLAKLLSESYPGSTQVAADHPGMADNPLSLNLDPDFIALNPGLDTSHWSEAAATLLTTSTSSQVMEQLTSYIASDPAAVAFLNGKVETEPKYPGDDNPYQMHVNPAYKGIGSKLPVDSWPLLDTWQNTKSTNSCLLAQGTSMPPYMPLVANPVTDLNTVAQALLYNWPNVQTACSGLGTDQSPYQLGRIAPQGLGSRFMLGLVTLGDAQRYGLTTASLQAAPGHYVAPTNAGMLAALALGKPTDGMRPFDLTQAAIRKSPSAYPGTMMVYTAAKTYGLNSTTAKDVSQFIRISSTQGQVPGRGNGQLAAGYVPIKDAGVTKPYFRQAQAVAAAVAAQKAPRVLVSPGKPGTSPAPGGTTPVGTTPGGTTPAGTTPAGTTTPAGLSTTPGDAPSGTVPSSAPSGTTSPVGTTTPVSSAPVADTAAVSSKWSGGLLIGLLIIGLVATIGLVGGQITLRLKGLR